MHRNVVAVAAEINRGQLVADRRSAFESSCLQASHKNIIRYITLRMIRKSLKEYRHHSRVTYLCFVGDRWQFLTYQQLLTCVSLRRLRVQTGSGAHPPSYPVGAGDKAAGAWSWQFICIWHRD